MFWIAPRVVGAAAWVSAATWLGHWLGGVLGWERVGMCLGAAAGTTLLVAWDTWRGARVMRWLLLHSQEPAPLESGFWGGLALRTERALRQREAQASSEQANLSHFLQAIEASPNGVLLLDPQEQIEWSSAIAAEHLGLDVQRDLRQRITNLVRSPAFVAALHGPQIDQTVQIARLRGPGTLSITVRSFGEGRRLLLTQDITERERAEAMRRDFVANVSHEIRTPLTVLSGFVETMLTLPLSEPERQRVLSRMVQQTGRMQALVGDLLALARLEGSPRPASDTWVNLDQLGRAVEFEARGLSAGRHQFVFDWGQGIQLAGNDNELQSALANLVNNAVRYTPGEGGQIQVSCQVRQDRGVSIQIMDTGPGIAPEHIPRLTERFYRVDGSRSRETGGTGLGLSIVKHVVQRHGGELGIQSELGKGSVFTLTLPPSRCRVQAALALSDQAD